MKEVRGCEEGMVRRSLSSMTVAVTSSLSCIPFILTDLRHVFSVFPDECLVLDPLVANGLLGIGRRRSQADAFDHIGGQVIPVHVVQEYHVERRGGRALFLVATHV